MISDGSHIMNKNILRVFFTLIGLIFSGCGKEMFSASKSKQLNKTSPIVKNTSQSCSNFTLIKPEVDFLFLWDNSTSSVFINDQTKAALNNTIDLVSSRFDYHMLLAPLVGSGNANAKLISETPDGLSSSALSMKIDRALAADTFKFSLSKS